MEPRTDYDLGKFDGRGTVPLLIKEGRRFAIYRDTRPHPFPKGKLVGVLSISSYGNYCAEHIGFVLWANDHSLWKRAYSIHVVRTNRATLNHLHRFEWRNATEFKDGKVISNVPGACVWPVRIDPVSKHVYYGEHFAVALPLIRLILGRERENIRRQAEEKRKEQAEEKRKERIVEKALKRRKYVTEIVRLLIAAYAIGDTEQASKRKRKRKRNGRVVVTPKYFNVSTKRFVSTYTIKRERYYHKRVRRNGKTMVRLAANSNDFNLIRSVYFAVDKRKHLFKRD